MNSRVSDLGPLRGMALTGVEFLELRCVRSVATQRDASDESLLQRHAGVRRVAAARREWNLMDKVLPHTQEHHQGDRRNPPNEESRKDWEDRWVSPVAAAADFWKKYDAGEFGKPDSTAAIPDRKPITRHLDDPAFQGMDEDRRRPACRAAGGSRRQEVDGTQSGLRWEDERALTGMVRQGSRTATFRSRQRSKPCCQMGNALDVRPEHVFGYIAFTVVFLLVAWLVHFRAVPLGTSLVFWGVLVVVLSCGYALLGVPPMMLVTPALTKIGFLLVLGGVAWSLLRACCPNQPANKEADHV